MGFISQLITGGAHLAEQFESHHGREIVPERWGYSIADLSSQLKVVPEDEQKDTMKQRTFQWWSIVVNSG